MCASTANVNLVVFGCSASQRRMIFFVTIQQVIFVVWNKTITRFNVKVKHETDS